jgi:hypothetical protein
VLVVVVVVAVVVLVRGHAAIIAAARTASGPAYAGRERHRRGIVEAAIRPCALGNAPARRAGRSPVCGVGATARTRGPTLAGRTFGRER